MDDHVTLGGVHLTGHFHQIHTAVVVAVGHQDQGSAAFHGAQEGLVGLQAVAHVGHAAEGGKAAAQGVDTAIHGGAVPGALFDDGAVRSDGVQAALEVQGGDGGVDALQGDLGHFDLVLLHFVILHHHGAGVVHDEVEAVDLLAADRSGHGSHGEAQKNRGGKGQQAERFHDASQKSYCFACNMPGNMRQLPFSFMGKGIDTFKN